MGYSVRQTEQKFFLPSNKIDACIAAILNDANRAREVASAKIRVKYFDNIPAIFQLVELVKDLWSFQLIPNKHGDIDKVEYECEKLHDYEGFCDAVAPYVESGSYIEFRGGDGGLFRFLFKDNAWKKVVPSIVWPT